MMTPDVESELIIACRRGEARMYEPLVRAYEPRALRFAVGMLGDGDAARDATQDAFVSAYNKLDRFEVGRPFGPWFFRILRNRCLDELRKIQTRRKAEGAVEQMNGKVHGRVIAAEREVEKKAAAELLWAGLERISPDHRAAIVLRELEGMSYTEMAEALDVPEGTIASRLFHARRELRAALEDMGVRYGREGAA